MFTRRLFAGPLAGAGTYARVVGGLWLIALLAIGGRAGAFPHRQSSYAADYAPAGWHWLQGAEIYNWRRHFVYSPPTAAFFAPFAALPDAVGGVAWRLCCAGLLWTAAAAWLRSRLSGSNVAPPAQRTGAHALPTGMLLLLPLAVGNLNLGQMNVGVLVLLTAGVLAVEREAWNLAAGLLAAAAFVKIYPLALGLLLALLYPRQLSWRLPLALAGGFVVSFALQRPGYVWMEYHHWFAVLGRDDRLDVDLFATWRDFPYLLRASGVSVPPRAYRIMEVASGGVLALFLFVGQRGGRWGREKLLGGTFCLGCAWMMLFGPATEAATYVVLSLPVCGLLVAAWSLPTQPAGKSVLAARIIFTAVYLLLLLSEVANSWFHGLTHHLFMRGLQPIAALGFVGGVVWLLLRPLPAAPAGSMLAHADAHDENGGVDRRID